jgi:16S rRNA pseudouridine516 synthase
MAKERLDKILAHLGYGSRKEIHYLARDGFILVDGLVVKDVAQKVDPLTSSLQVGEDLVVYQQYFHMLLHKPAGYVTSTRDPAGIPITDLLPERDDWMPVGRLDKDTEGLLLITTDGDLLHRLTHPRWKVPKRYYVRLEQPATPKDTAAFAAGMTLDEEVLQPAALTLLKDSDAELTIREGKYHQIKRMFAARGNHVTYLKRLSMGPLELPDNLPVGEARPLNPQELEAIYACVGLKA